MVGSRHFDGAVLAESSDEVVPLGKVCFVSPGPVTTVKVEGQADGDVRISVGQPLPTVVLYYDVTLFP